MFWDEYLLCVTPNNTLSYVVSSRSIKIGQLFENKEDLHLYAMKKIFFKVKKPGKMFGL